MTNIKTLLQPIYKLQSAYQLNKESNIEFYRIQYQLEKNKVA